MTNNDIDLVKCWWFYCEHAKQVVCCNKCCKVLKPETSNKNDKED